jgi:pyridoxamine 5'-phosphate oxidase
VIPDRASLERRVAELDAELDGRDIPRPATWVGYRVVPETWEFWQHRDSRLHDRFRYRRDDGEWIAERLAP